MAHYTTLGPIITPGQYPPGGPNHIGQMMGYPFPPNMKQMETIPDMMSQSMDGIPGMEDHTSVQVPFTSPSDLNGLTNTNMNAQNGQNHLELMHDMLNSF